MMKIDMLPQAVICHLFMSSYNYSAGKWVCQHLWARWLQINSICLCGRSVKHMHILEFFSFLQKFIVFYPIACNKRERIPREDKSLGCMLLVVVLS